MNKTEDPSVSVCPARLIEGPLSNTKLRNPKEPKEPLGPMKSTTEPYKTLKNPNESRGILRNIKREP